MWFVKFCISISCISMLLFAACSSTNEDPSTLVVGLEGSYPPFEFVNKEGKLVGFDLEVASQIAQASNKKLVIKVMEFDGLILALKQKKIDLIISGLNITADRLKEIAMVPYHGDGINAFSLLFWEKIPKNVESIADLASYPNAVVSVETGTVMEEHLKQFHAIQSRSFPDALQSLMDIKYGKSMAYFADPSVAEYLKAQHPQIKSLTVPIKAEEKPLGYGIGIHKENKALEEQIRGIIQEMKASGFLKQLEEKWFIKETQNVY